MTTTSPKRTATRRRLIGTVKSTKMAKTVTVSVSRRIQHPKYGKTYTVSRAFKAHETTGKIQVGDVVEIEETRPISAHKNWRVVRVVTPVASSAI